MICACATCNYHITAGCYTPLELELLRDRVVNDDMLNDDMLNDDTLHGGTLAIGARSAPLPGAGAERRRGRRGCGGVAPPPTPELGPAGPFSPGPA